AVQPDGKILVGGDITNYNGFSYWTNGSPIFGIVRLNPDGAIDFPFSVATGFGTMGQAVKSIALQPDGKILLAGAFQSFNGNNDYHYLVRLNPEGTIDTTFN